MFKKIWLQPGTPVCKLRFSMPTKQIIGILSQNFDSFLKGVRIPEVRDYLITLVKYMYGAYGVSEEDVERMLDIISDSKTSEEAVQKVYAAGFVWNNPDNKYGSKYRAYKTSTDPDIRSEAVRQFVKGPVVYDVATGNTSMLNKIIGPIRGRVTSARGSDIVVNEEQLHEIQAKASQNGIEFLPQSLAEPGKLPDGIEDHSVDTVTIIGALHHMTDEVRDSILREAHRILNPDGRLVILEDTTSDVDPMTFASGTYKEDVRQQLLGDFLRMSRENQNYIFALVDWMGNHLVPGDTSIPLSFNFKTRQEWHEIFRNASFEVEAEANLGVTPYKFHTHPELIFSLKKKPESKLTAEVKTSHVSEKVVTQHAIAKYTSFATLLQQAMAGFAPDTAQTLVVETEAVSNRALVLDIQETLKNVNTDKLGKIVVYTEEKAMKKANELRDLIKEANEGLDVLIRSRSDIAKSRPKVNSVKETEKTEALVEYLRLNGIIGNNKDVLGIIRGHVMEAQKKELREFLRDELKIPVIEIQSTADEYFYSFAEALGMAIEAKEEDSQANVDWLKTLPPITKVTQRIRKLFRDHQASLEALRAL
jgi:ubiquinone/menaquinone biosynthesis C-methylase UbiE